MQKLVELVRTITAEAWESKISNKENYEFSEFYNKFLEGKGFTKLGHGCFGYVFKCADEQGNEYAVKMTGFSYENKDSYPSFAKFCNKYKDLKHLPTLHHFEEYFYNFEGEGATEKERHFFNRCNGYYFVFMPVYKPLTLNHTEVRSISRMIKYGAKYARETDELRNIAEHRRDSLLETCDALFHIVGGKWVDVHDGNIMDDENGEPVIIDPFSFTSSGGGTEQDSWMFARTNETTKSSEETDDSPW